MGKIFILGLFLAFASHAEDIKSKQKTMITIKDTTIKYMNFQPKQVDTNCLESRVDKLFKVIENDREAQRLFNQISKEYDAKKNEKIREKIESLSGELLQKKHISYKGNHEWRAVVSRKYLMIENSKKSIYVMYPLEPNYIIFLDKPYDAFMDSNGYDIGVRSLKHWIDMKKCIH